MRGYSIARISFLLEETFKVINYLSVIFSKQKLCVSFLIKLI